MDPSDPNLENQPASENQNSLIERVHKAQAERDLVLWQHRAELLTSIEGFIALTHHQDECLEAIGNNTLHLLLENIRNTDPWVKKLNAAQNQPPSQQSTPAPSIPNIPPVENSVTNPVPASIPTTASELLQTGTLPVIPLPPPVISAQIQQEFSGTDVNQVEGLAQNTQNQLTDVPDAFKTAFSGEEPMNKLTNDG